MQNLRKLSRFVRPYLKESIYALVLLTAVVVMDLAIPRLIQRIVDQGITPGDLDVVVSTTIWMLVISLVSTVFAIGNNYLSVRAGEGFARDLREALYLKIQSFSFGNLDRLNTGQLIVRLTSDIAMQQRMTRMFLRIGTRAPLLMIGSLILLFSTNTRLALAILPVLLVTTAVIVFFVTRMGPMFLRIQQKLDQLNMVLQENISGVRLIKAFVRAEHENQRFEAANRDFAETTIRVMQFTAYLFPLLQWLVNIGIVVIIWVGGLQAIAGDLTIGEIIAFTNYLLTTLTPLAIMAMLSNLVASANASAERIVEVLETEPEVQDAPGSPALPPTIQGRVVFEQVSFHYNGSCDQPVLQDINLVAEPGQTVAILGATGAGKSSLIHLVPRFYDASRGQVRIDGVDVRSIQHESLLSQVGVALQEAVLFSGTVRENICFGKPGASDEEVVTAAKAAQAHEFILELPQGYDTHVNQRGVNLSGGQKQRISIARALLLQPKILILDDSTSSVDVETETHIQAALDELMRGRTSFVVAQRISTVLNADKIIVLDQGRIAAEGTHQELLRSSPIYQEIYDSQLGNGLALAASD
ncbi:MAG: ABC transporter ATP-binding protein [Anaerolineales bacterium]|nr:ABC transporter ATP-binding protein [Anaerolineales bacterium]